MRLIDADALMEILTTAIRNMKGMAKFLGAEDDPEIQMEIKAYTDIANGVNDMPTIEPEREPGKWIYDGDGYKCNKCGAVYGWWADSQTSNFCPNCGSDMRGEQDE